MSSRYDFELPVPDFDPDEDVLDVVFNVTRASGIELGSNSRQWFLAWTPDGNQEPAPPNVIRARLLPDQRNVPGVEIQSRGERAEFVKYVLRDASLDATRVFVVKPNPGLEEIIDLDEAIKSSPGPKEILRELRGVIDAVDDERRPLLDFFYDFDLHTNNVLWDYLEVELDEGETLDDWIDEEIVPFRGYAAGYIKTAFELLKQRIEKRNDAYPEPGDRVVLSRTDRDKMQDLSTIQVELYRRHGIDFSRAFELFANGELRMVLPSLVASTQPSSGFYFLFAEFALLAMENGLHADEWARLFPAFVRSQEFLAEAYGTRRHEEAGTYGSYGPLNFVEPLSSERKEALAKEYEGLDLGGLKERALENTHRFLWGEVSETEVEPG